MHVSVILSIVLATTCYINFATATAYSANCKCNCCITTKEAACKSMHLGSVSLDLTECDDSKCIGACKNQYKLCELSKNTIQATCSYS